MFNPPMWEPFYGFEHFTWVALSIPMLWVYFIGSAIGFGLGLLIGWGRGGHHHHYGRDADER